MWLWFWCLTPLSTFNNISVISWRSVFIGGRNRSPGGNHRPVESHSKTLSLCCID